MPRAVLDSSVLVSAFLSPEGTPAALLARARAGDFIVCSSHEIVAETAEALFRPRTRRGRDYTSEEVARFCMTLARISELAINLPTISVVEKDPKDDMIVATAIAARADYLVTGDHHLLDLSMYEAIRIVTPRAFLDKLPKGSFR